MKVMKKLKNVNLIQFVPAVFVISMVGNSILGYTAPKVQKTSVGAAKEVKAETKKAKAVSGGDLDLSKIKDGTYEGTGTGFRGQVKVAVTVKSHKITAIKVLSSSDDAAYFNRASKGVIQSIISKQSLNVDAVSGATYSSKGIIAAVKNALTGEKDNSSAAGAGTSGGSAGSVGKAEEADTYKDGTYQGIGTGFHGTVKVAVTIKNNKIKSIKILEHHDDAAYFNRASGQLLPLIVKRQTTNVDTVSGATYSSNGIIKAVRNALSKAAVKSSSKKSEEKKKDKDKKPASENVSGTYKDGTYQGTGTGFKGKITVKVTIKYSKITQIQIVKNEKDDAAYFNRALGVIDNIIALQRTDVDVVSGATYSSNGIIEAVKNALKKALVKDDDNKKDDTSGTEQPKPEDSKPTTPEDKIYTGTAVCYPDDDNEFDPYDLSLEIVVSADGKVKAIQNVKGTKKDGYFYESTNDALTRMAFNQIEKQFLAGKDVNRWDAVSGATCSSYAIQDAYMDAVSKIK